MNLKLRTQTTTVKGNLAITGSKSESNRLLILQALFPLLKIENCSESDDSVVLRKALNSVKSEIDVHHAGTAMRFLTAYLAIQDGRKTILTGSKRMQERPIKILVEALRSLGAEINYLKEEGFPPLEITGKSLTKSEVRLPAHVSSQYISALLLIAPALPKGLSIELLGEITSKPYLQMTVSLLQRIGVQARFKGNQIFIPSAEVEQHTLEVESDWSSASYFYSLAALAESADIQLAGFMNDSIQGDSVLVDLYKFFGVKTSYTESGIRLTKVKDFSISANFKADLADCPDLAQTIVVTCLGLGLECELTGLHTLKIKETDRLLALQAELKKFGASIKVTKSSLILKSCKKLATNVLVNTYNDHRMAMAFAPLALCVNLQIANPEVVSKSFSDFWQAIGRFGVLSEPVFL